MTILRIIYLACYIIFYLENYDLTDVIKIIPLFLKEFSKARFSKISLNPIDNKNISNDNDAFLFSYLSRIFAYILHKLIFKDALIYDDFFKIRLATIESACILVDNLKNIDPKNLLNIHCKSEAIKCLIISMINSSPLQNKNNLVSFKLIKNSNKYHIIKSEIMFFGKILELGISLDPFLKKILKWIGLVFLYINCYEFENKSDINNMTKQLFSSLFYAYADNHLFQIILRNVLQCLLDDDYEYWKILDQIEIRNLIKYLFLNLSSKQQIIIMNLYIDVFIHNIKKINNNHITLTITTLLIDLLECLKDETILKFIIMKLSYILKNKLFLNICFGETCADYFYMSLYLKIYRMYMLHISDFENKHIMHNIKDKMAIVNSDENHNCFKHLLFEKNIGLYEKALVISTYKLDGKNELYQSNFDNISFWTHNIIRNSFFEALFNCLTRYHKFYIFSKIVNKMPNINVVQFELNKIVNSLFVLLIMDCNWKEGNYDCSLLKPSGIAEKDTFRVTKWIFKIIIENFSTFSSFLKQEYVEMLFHTVIIKRNGFYRFNFFKSLNDPNSNVADALINVLNLLLRNISQKITDNYKTLQRKRILPQKKKISSDSLNFRYIENNFEYICEVIAQSKQCISVNLNEKLQISDMISNIDYILTNSNILHEKSFGQFFLKLCFLYLEISDDCMQSEIFLDIMY